MVPLRVTTIQYSSVFTWWIVCR